MWIYLKAVIGVVLIVTAWVAIEMAWRRVFGRPEGKQDGCGGCMTCTNECDSRGLEPTTNG